MKKKSLRKIHLYLVIFLLIILSTGAVFGYRIFSSMYSPNINLPLKEHTFINIPTSSTYQDVISLIDSLDLVVNIESFKWVSSKMGYPQSIKPGRYRVTHGMSNRELISILRAGLQTPTRVTFTGFRTPQQLAQRISKQIEADSVEIVQGFSNVDLIKEFGFTPETFIAMFIPNTYEFFWNTNADAFFARMKREYETFWNNERTKKANDIGLDRIKVSTLASIVEEETVKVDEQPRVAGVFMNRLNKKMPLQADPTIRYANGDFSIRRILTLHTQIDSPYNTYKNRGLPPGPINAPSISSINAVLNHEKHQYLYFCAKPDYSGYHAFARTLTEHNRNASEYQNFLNRERIYR
jgi:UPF0755 protein